MSEGANGLQILVHLGCVGRRGELLYVELLGLYGSHLFPLVLGGDVMHWLGLLLLLLLFSLLPLRWRTKIYCTPGL